VNLRKNGHKKKESSRLRGGPGLDMSPREERQPAFINESVGQKYGPSRVSIDWATWRGAVGRFLRRSGKKAAVI